MAKWTRPRKMLVAVSFFAILIWMIGPLRVILLPMLYLNTHLHEGSHALAAVATLGHVDNIQVFANGEGVTRVRGGIGPVVSFAGYLGAALIGGMLILWGRKPDSARKSLIGLAVILGAITIVWVRGDWMGAASALLWTISLAAAGKYLSNDSVLFAAQFLGIQQCLFSLGALRDLVLLSANGVAQTDAGNMQRMTGVPAIVWAILWSIVGLGIVFASLRAAWRESNSLK